MQILAEIREIIRRSHVGPAPDLGQLELSDPLDRHGIDSITLTYILTHFERRYSVEFANDSLTPGRYESIGALVSSISHAVGDA